MSSFYYLGVGVFSLTAGIDNFEIGSLGNDYTVTSTEVDETGNITNGSNIFPTLTIIIGVIYIIIILVLVLYLSCVINSLSNQLPDDFLNMGKCKKFFACFCKIFPPILIILSWVNFILIIVIWIMIVVNKDDTYKDSNGQDVDYRKDVEILNLVNSIIWILLHYGGSIIREMTYQQPFMYSPDTGAPNCCRTLFLNKLGP